MAVKREEVLATLTLHEIAQVQAAENEIDAALRTFDGRSKIVYCTKWSTRVIDRLIAMYRNAGWTVALEHGDQRDPGTWLRFQ